MTHRELSWSMDLTALSHKLNETTLEPMRAFAASASKTVGVVLGPALDAAGLLEVCIRLAFARARVLVRSTATPRWKTDHDGRAARAAGGSRLSRVV